MLNYPYRKPKDGPVCIHCQPNPPPSIIKNLPAFIRRRSTEISSDEVAFAGARSLYKHALKESEYIVKAEYPVQRKDGVGRNGRNTQVILPGSTHHIARMPPPTLAGYSAA